LDEKTRTQGSRSDGERSGRKPEKGLNIKLLNGPSSSLVHIRNRESIGEGLGEGTEKLSSENSGKENSNKKYPRIR